MSVHDDINAGKYRNDKPYPLHNMVRPEARKQFAAYRKEEERLYGLFRADLLAELGITEHPKADTLFRIAWDRGHSSGFSEVANEAVALVELLR